MNPRNLLILVVALGVQALCVTDSHAATKPPPPPRKQEKATPVPTHTTIEAISADSITLNEPNGKKTYKITKDTEFDLKGEKVKLEDLKVGMRASVSVGSSPDVARRISASEAPPEAPGKK
jgi:hypothetical protein